MCQEHPIELRQPVESSSPGEEQVHNIPVTQGSAEVSPKGNPIIDPIAQTSAP